MRRVIVLISLLGATGAAAQQAMQPIEQYEKSASVAEAKAVADQLRATAAKLDAKRSATESAAPPTGDGKSAFAAPQGGKIVNGTKTSSFPTVGALIKGPDAAAAGSWCSGTLIGSKTFLTAAHCVEEDPTPSQYHVFFQHGGVYDVASIDINENFDFPDADLAVIHLQDPVTGIAPTAVNSSGAVPTGSPGMIVGFGRSGGMHEDYGLKRTGRISTATCTNTAARLVCWNFDGPVGMPGENSNTCNADSGGPMFIQRLTPDLILAGVTSGGKASSECLQGDHSYDVDVVQFAPWIAQKAATDLGQTANGLPLYGSAKVQVLSSDGMLDTANASRTHLVSVPANTKLIRVAMNAEDDGQDDFDLTVSETGASGRTCTRTGTGQYAFCELPNPAAGDASVQVSRKAGAGAYQVTATLFAGQ